MAPKKSKHRIVFMGSPDFALHSLKALHENFSLIGIVTQPDRPSGRGRKLQAPPVKSLAESLDIPFIQPNKLTEASAMHQLEQWAPDMIVVAAFGQILRKNMLTMPKFGCVNVHASLLPRWRGASPLQAAILAGDSQTGITIMQMDRGLDTGPILSQQSIAISDNETSASLEDKLSLLGAELLINTMPQLLAGKISPQAQEDSSSTYASMLKKIDGLLDFSENAIYLERKVRAFRPWPGSFFTIDGESIKIHRARTLMSKAPSMGRLSVIDRLPAVSASDGWLLLEELQAPGKKSMQGEDFLRSGRKWEGQITTISSEEKT